MMLFCTTIFQIVLGERSVLRKFSSNRTDCSQNCVSPVKKNNRCGSQTGRFGFLTEPDSTRKPWKLQKPLQSRRIYLLGCFFGIFITQLATNRCWCFCNAILKNGIHGTYWVYSKTKSGIFTDFQSIFQVLSSLRRSAMSIEMAQSSVGYAVSLSFVG